MNDINSPLACPNVVARINVETIFFLLQHEDASVQMFDYLVHDNDLIGAFEKYNLSDVDREFIKEQIRGPSKNMKTKV